MQHQGFTLIELVLTVSVMALMVVTAIPSFNNIGSSRCEGAARKLVSDMSYARKLARSRNAVYGLSFDAGTEQYQVYLFDPATNSETTITDALTGTPFIVQFDTLPGLSGVNIQNPNFGGTSKIRFTPEGTPQDGNGAALAAAGTVILASGGDLRTVTLQPSTGEVSYQ